MRRRRQRLTLAITGLLLVVLAATAPTTLSRGYTDPDQDVTAFGRNVTRSHYAPGLAGWTLCHQWELPVGPSRSQPLLVARDYGNGTRVYLHHLAGDSLWSFDLGPAEEPEPVQNWRAYTALQKRNYPDEAELQNMISEINQTGKDGSPRIWRTQLHPKIPIPDLSQYGYIKNDKGPWHYSHSHAAYWKHPSDPNKDVIFASSGYGTIVALRARTHELLGEHLIPHTLQNYDWGVSAAPLPLNADAVVVPTTDGHIYVIAGFQNKAPKQVSEFIVPARLSSTTIMLDDVIIFGSDGETGGSHIRALSIGRYGKGQYALHQEWSQPTRSGVPAGVALYDHVVYAADKSGQMYALNTRNGNQLWTHDAGGWTNIEPSIGKDTVYFTLRSTTRLEDANAHGQLIAMAKEGQNKQGVVRWSKPLDSRGNTSPTVIRSSADGDEVVLTADEAGRVRTWSQQGVQESFAIHDFIASREGRVASYSCDGLETSLQDPNSIYIPADRVDLATDVAFASETRWDPINGAGTQPSVGHGFVAVGINLQGSSQDKPVGTLRVYRSFPAVDIGLAEIQVVSSLSSSGPPPTEAIPNEPVEVRGRLRMTSLSRRLLPPSVTVGAAWQGNANEPRAANTVDAIFPAADCQEVSGTFACLSEEFKVGITAPGTQGEYDLAVIVNSQHVLSIAASVRDPDLRARLNLTPQDRERLLRAPGTGPLEPTHNNLGFRKVKVVNPCPDVSVISPVADKDGEGRHTVSVTVKNPGPGTVKAYLQLQTGGSLRDQTDIVPLPPGTKARPRTRTFQLTAGVLPPGDHALTVQIVPTNCDDPNLLNNSTSISITVDPPPPPTAPGKPPKRSRLRPDQP